MDLTPAGKTLLRLLYLRWQAIGRARHTCPATLAEIVDCLDADRFAVADLLEDLQLIGWVAARSHDDEGGLTITAYVLTDQGRYVAAATMTANRELGFDV